MKGTRLKYLVRNGVFDKISKINFFKIAHPPTISKVFQNFKKLTIMSGPLVSHPPHVLTHFLSEK